MPDASATPVNTPVPSGRRLSGLTAAAASAAASAAGGTAASRKSGGSGGSSGSRSSGSRSSTAPSGSTSSSSSSRRRPPSPLALSSTTAPDADNAAAAARGMRTSTSTETATTTSSDDESTSTSGGTVQRPGGISRKYVSTLVRRWSMSTEADGTMALAVPTTTGAKDTGEEERIAEVPSSEDVPDADVGVSRPVSSTPAPTQHEGDDTVSMTTSASSTESVYYSFPSLVPDDTAALAAAVLARPGAGTPTQRLSTPTTLSLPPPQPPTIPTMTVIPPPLSTTTTSSAPRKPKSILRTPLGSRDLTASGPPVIARTRDIAKIKAVMFRAQLVDVREISRMSLSTNVSDTSSTHQLDQNAAAMVSSLFLDFGGNTSIVVPAAPAPAAAASAYVSPESVGPPPMPSSFSASDLADLMLLSDSLGWTPPGSPGRGNTMGSSIPSTPPTLSRNLRRRPPTAPRPRRESPMASTAGLPPPPPPGRGSAIAAPPPRQPQQANTATRRRAASEVTGRTAVTAFLAKARRNSGSNSGGGGGTAASGAAETVVVMRP
ncbi:hypothetical protein GGF31_006054 [Allomyces arbusculus]|nr:hypothetical protein GGF31_006054 [Allomyces arbusculus]